MKKMVLFLIMAAPLIIHCPPPPSYYESSEYSRATKDKNHYFRFEGDGFSYKLCVYTTPYSNYDVHLLLTIHNEKWDSLAFDASGLRVMYHETVQPLRRFTGDCGSEQSNVNRPCTIRRSEEIEVGYELWDNENTALPDTVTICVDGIVDPASDSVVHADCVIFTTPHK